MGSRFHSLRKLSSFYLRSAWNINQLFTQLCFCSSDITQDMRLPVREVFRMSLEVFPSEKKGPKNPQNLLESVSLKGLKDFFSTPVAYWEGEV